MKTGIELIAEERKRQVTKEGWTAEHDDEHDAGELAQAAISYINHAPKARVLSERRYRSEPSPDNWPWFEAWWNPKAPTRDLVKAGALIAAEIDRLLRLEKKTEINRLRRLKEKNKA